MNNGNIIVLDIGTTTAKTTVFDLGGKTLAFDNIPYKFLPKAPGFFEQDPEEVWNAILMSAKGAVDKAKEADSSFNPLIMSIVCQGGSLVPCDENGRQVYPMITWMDCRSEAIADKLNNSDFGKTVFDKTGRTVQAGLPFAMTLWLKENEPEVYKKAKRWPCLNDYCIGRLTGTMKTDPSSAGLSQFFNVNDNCWDEDVLAYAGLTKDAVSECIPSKDICGYLLSEPAKVMGLPVGLPIVNAMHDRTSEAVGLGSYKRGDSWIGTGTAWVICSIIDEDEGKGTLWTNYHAIEGYKIASNLVGGLGTSVEWWIPELMRRRNLNSRGEALKAMTELAKESPVGSNGLVFKAFTGAGNEGSFLNEKDSHTDADYCRAVYESIVFDFKKEYEAFAEHAPINGKLTLVGGAARSSYWPTIIAEILGIEIEVSTYEHDATLGAAILAGLQLGLADDIDGVFEIFKTGRRTVTPDPANVRKYEEIYKTYRSLM